MNIVLKPHKVLENVTFLTADGIVIKDIRKPISGVYMIDDAYIGQSFNIRRRIIHHLNAYISNNYVNEGLKSHLVGWFYFNIPLTITILSLDIKDELKMTLLHKPAFSNPNNCIYGRSYRIFYSNSSTCENR